jgi:hypothetical protein
MDNDHNKKPGKPIPVGKSFAKWHEVSAYQEAYAALDDEFVEAESTIARGAMTGKPSVEWSHGANSLSREKSLG